MKFSSLIVAAAVVLSFSSQVNAVEYGQKPEPAPLKNKCIECILGSTGQCKKVVSPDQCYSLIAQFCEKKCP